MSILRRLFGPKSKYDKSLPYTYMAKVPAFEGDKDLHSHYFSDTLCGLIEYLDENDIEPEQVQLFGLYKNKEVPLEKEYCITPYGKWLHRPEICKSMEARFKKTLEDRYKGHVEKDVCSFDDRTRDGSGPY